MAENVAQALQAISMMQQQTQELNQRLAAADHCAVAAEQTAAAGQVGAGATQTETRTLVDTRTLGKNTGSKVYVANGEIGRSLSQRFLLELTKSLVRSAETLLRRCKRQSKYNGLEAWR
eukprot:687942-Amphidinium_carterae.1